MKELIISAESHTFRRPYQGDNRDNSLANRSPGSLNETRTDSSFARGLEMNQILSDFAVYRTPMPATALQPMYGDFTGVTDLQTALKTIADARESFYALPEAIRRRFGHDPMALVQFCDNPQNYDEAVSLGLVVPSASLDTISTTDTGLSPGVQTPATPADGTA